jgi:hypothetical protein
VEPPLPAFFFNQLGHFSNTLLPCFISLKDSASLAALEQKYRRTGLFCQSGSGR